jgi:Ni,Fe-hydrogenase III small subunit/formate hydrogenlyase subunit 6/NADH:ubiquinone oxidoreductase subunit I
MLRILKRALTSAVATNAYPAVVIEPPEGFRGKPVIDFARCTGCDRCAGACPTSAISVAPDAPKRNERIVTLDYGDCIFCGECEAACPEAIHLTTEFQLAAADRSQLRTSALYRRSAGEEYRFVEILAAPAAAAASMEKTGRAVRESIRKLFGRSLHIREVDAGSCNGCEVEITSLNNPVYDIQRFGIQFVASPRQADMLLVTGPVTRNMEIALKQTFDAMPGPGIVVAAGACAIGGGIFGKSYASCGGVNNVLPVDVYIPGCPPRPEALLHGILLAVGRYSQKAPLPGTSGTGEGMKGKPPAGGSPGPPFVVERIS